MNLSSIGRKGFLHLLLIVVTSRISAFLAQWVMGIFLFKEDFGVIAIISVIYLLASGFKEVGLYQILQEHRKNFEEHARGLTASAQLVNLTGVLILLAAAPLIAHYYQDSRLIGITALLVLAMPFNIALLPYKASLAIKYDFKRISRVESISVLLSNGSLAVLAALGAGIYSYVVSQLILTLSAYLLYRQGQASIKAPLWPGGHNFRTFLSRSKWLVLSSYMNNLATRGDYLVLSLILSKSALGLYYFSYQLMAAAVQLIGMALNHLLLPLFSSIREDDARVRSGLAKAGDALTLMSGALCLSLLVWFPFLINFVWRGKWNEAIPLALIVTLAVPPRLLSSPLASSALEALAEYRTRTLLSVVDAVSLVALVWCGGMLHGTMGACFAMGLQRCTAGMLFYFAAMRRVGSSMPAATRQLLMHLFPYLTCAFLLILFVFQYMGYSHFLEMSFAETAVVYSLLISVYVALSYRNISNYVLRR